MSKLSVGFFIMMTISAIAQPVPGEILGRIYQDPVSHKWVFEKASPSLGYIMATPEVIQARLDTLNGAMK